MKRLVCFATLLLAVAFVVPAASESGLKAVPFESPTGIHPGAVNQLLKVAAETWSMSLGQAHVKYQAGEITLSPYPAAGPNYYMVVYGGFCILTALEDKF